MEQSLTSSPLRSLMRAGLGIPLFLVALMAMMVLPLPPFLLDVSFTFNIAFSLIVLLAVIYTQRPLDFAVFPTVLLVATLLRLALNIASTRVVLLNGHTAGAPAGEVIQAFGEVVIGGNYAVGLVVFTILIVINFVVVTKGAGRVSEVTARFTLDAMPGKQMAIDADLNAGLIDQEQARARREEVTQEADFYGSMDGASKFVRGDAIAGIIILIINLLGGLGIGVLQHGMPFVDAMRSYALLTIGDGLVAQIPSLFLSVAAAIMVTRVSKAQDMGQQVSHQLFSNPKLFFISGSVLFGLGIVPGMPHLPFLILAVLLAGIGYTMQNKEKQEAAARELQASNAQQPQESESRDISWDDVNPVDPIGLEVGYRLIPLVDKAQGGQLMARIKGVRKKLSQDLGFLVPPVHIRDNLDLGPNQYRLSLLGVSLGDFELYPDRQLAINPGKVFGELEGIATQDPAFKLDAIWIQESLKEKAQSYGYTVVDASTVVATHISRVIQTHAHEILGHEEVQHLLEKLSTSAPKLVEDLVPEKLPMATVVKVLQSLLEEGIPVKDSRTIIETLADVSSRSQDPGILTEYVRQALRRMIVQTLYGTDAELPVMTIDQQLEQILLQSTQGGREETAVLEPGLAERLQQSLATCVTQQEAQGQPAVLLVPGPVRKTLAKFAKAAVNGLQVLSYQEVPDDKQIRIVQVINP